jgi:hypothetical protein
MTRYVYNIRLSQKQHEFLINFLTKRIEESKSHYSKSDIPSDDEELIEKLQNVPFPTFPVISVGEVQLSHLMDIFTSSILEKDIKFEFGMDLSVKEYIDFFERVNLGLKDSVMVSTSSSCWD